MSELLEKLVKEKLITSGEEMLKFIKWYENDNIPEWLQRKIEEIKNGRS